MKTLPITLMLLLITISAAGAIRSEAVEYKQGETALQGFVYWDDAVQGKRPGIVVVHEWFGVNDFSKSRAEMLAKMGYVALAADIYGKGVNAKNVEEAAQMSGMYKSNRALLRQRVAAAVETLRKNPNVNGAKIGGIGFCFGGTTVLELARSGADVSAVVSFHGGLDTNMPAAQKPKAKVLVLHGAVDPFVPPPQVQGFMDEMNKVGADYQFIAYSGAVHSFTNPGADALNLAGAKYHKPTDERSWQHMKVFFEEAFR